MKVSATNRWKLGLFALLGMGLGFVTIIWLGTYGVGRRTLPIVSYFDESVQGLDVGSAVKFRGVPIGHVSGISIAPDRRHVEVTSEIDVNALERLGFSYSWTAFLEEEEVPLDLRMRLVTLGITGLKFLEVDIVDPDALSSTDLPFEPRGRHFPSNPSVLKSAEEGLMEVLNRFPELEQQATQTLAEAQATLSTLRRAVEPFTQEGRGMDRLAGRLEDAAASLEVVARSLDEAIRQAELGRTSAAIREAADSVADMAHEGTGLGGELRDDLVSLRETLAAVRSLADSLERDPAALLRGRTPDAGPGGGR